MIMHKLRYDKLWFYIALFLLPFQVYVGAVFIILSYLTWLIYRQGVHIQRNDYLLFIMLCTMLLTTLVAINRYEHLTLVCAFLLPLSLYFLARKYSDDKEHIIKLLSIVGCIFAITGIVQIFHPITLKLGTHYVIYPPHPGGITGFTPNPIILAHFLTLVMIVSLYLVYKDIRWLPVIPICATAILFTKTWGGYFAILVTLSIGLYISHNRRLRRILLIFLICFAVAQPLVPGAVADLLSRWHIMDGTSAEGQAPRLILMKAGIEIYKTHNKLLGVGLGGTKHLLPYYLPHDVWDRLKNYDYIHCIYESLLVETGAMGLLTFMLLIGVAVRNFRSLKHNPLCMLMGLAIIFACISNLIDKTLLLLNYTYPFWIYLGILQTEANKLGNKRVASPT